LSLKARYTFDEVQYIDAPSSSSLMKDTSNTFEVVRCLDVNGERKCFRGRLRPRLAWTCRPNAFGADRDPDNPAQQIHGISASKAEKDLGALEETPCSWLMGGKLRKCSKVR
jgi:hypothetical protein